MTIMSKDSIGPTSHTDSDLLTLDARVAMHGKISNRIEEHPRMEDLCILPYASFHERDRSG